MGNEAKQSKVDPREQLASVWEFDSEEQKDAMMESLTQENCGKKLHLIRDVSGMSRRDLARVIGVAESTIYRLETGKTLPTMDFMLRLSALVAIGHARFSKMSTSEKEKISEYIGTTGGIDAEWTDEQPGELANYTPSYESGSSDCQPGEVTISDDGLLSVMPRQRSASHVVIRTGWTAQLPPEAVEPIRRAIALAEAKLSREAQA